MITITPFIIPPILGMPTIKVLANEIGTMTPDEPARLVAHMEVCTAAAATRKDAAALIHFLPTGHCCRVVPENDHRTSSFKAFVMEVMGRKLPVDSDDSKQLYLRYMTRFLEGRIWDAIMIFPVNLKRNPLILTPFDIYNHIEAFAKKVTIKRATDVEVVPAIRTGREIFL